MTIEKRPFGRTEHMSSAVIFGSAALRRSTRVPPIGCSTDVESRLRTGDRGPGRPRRRTAGIGPWMDRHRGAFYPDDQATDRWSSAARRRPITASQRQPQTTGSISLAATPICCSARSPSATGPRPLGRGRGPGLQIYRQRGQRAVFHRSRAGCTWSAASGPDLKQLSIIRPCHEIWDYCAGRPPDLARAPRRDGARHPAQRRRRTLGCRRQSWGPRDL